MLFGEKKYTCEKDTNHIRQSIWCPQNDAGLEETQAGIKIAGRNISNLGYTDDTSLMAESKAELKSLLIKVKRKVRKLA